MFMTRQLLQKFLNFFRRDPALTALLILSAAYFMLFYLTDPNLPSGAYSALLPFQDNALYPKGWFGYYDQGQYLRLAHTLADFNFTQLHHTYTYGLGYPLTAVPMLWLGFSSDPFLPFNLFVFVFAIYAVYRAAQRLISPLAGWLAGFGLAFATPLVQYVDQPWNSTVCLLAMSGILLVASKQKLTKWHAAALGLLVGWAFAARYVDVLWLAPLALTSLYRGSWRTLLKWSIGLVIGMSVVIVPVLYSHDRYFGSPFRTPYVQHIGIGGAGGSDQGLQAYKLNRVPHAALGMFVSPRWAGSQDTDRGWLIHMFWIIAAVPGVVIMMRKSRKLFLGTFLLMAIIASVFYLSFRASGPDSLKYGTLHYYKLFWPGMVVLATAYFDSLLRRAVKQKSPRSKRSPT
jgi:hypothetical protein